MRYKRCYIHGNVNILCGHTAVSGTNTEFYVPDRGSQAAIMAKFRAFMLNPELFRTTFGTFPNFPSLCWLKQLEVVKCLKNYRKWSKMTKQITFALFRTHKHIQHSRHSPPKNYHHTPLSIVTLGYSVVTGAGIPKKIRTTVHNSGPIPDHFEHFGPEPDQVQNSGPYWSHCCSALGIPGAINLPQERLEYYRITEGRIGPFTGQGGPALG